MRTILGLDVGTSSVKAAVFDEAFQELASASEAYEVLRPFEDWAEIDAGALWAAVTRCIKALSERVSLEGTAAIGIAAMCPGLAALDGSGRPLRNPILYCDRRSQREAEEIIRQVGEDRLFEITANRMMSGAISATSMLWIKRHEPRVYERTRYFGHLNTLLAAKMTGRIAIDPSNASYTGLFEVRGGRKWSQELCEAVGVGMEKLPPIVESIEPCGRLSCRALIELGLPAGTAVMMGGADTACTAAACGAIHSGDMFESVGTTDVLTVCVEKPVFLREFINRYHVYPGRWMYQGAMSNTGFAQSWCMDQLCRDFRLQSPPGSPDQLFQRYDMEAEASRPGAGGVVFLPYLTGERCPIWDPKARGVFFGIGSRTERRDLIRAVVESGGYGAKNLIELCEAATGLTFREIDMVGGGARSRAMAQIRADVTGKRVNILKNVTAAMGAAVLAAVGGGLYPSIEAAAERVKVERLCSFEPTQDTTAREIYTQRYETYLALYQAVKSLY